jgi:uroporphyrinogen-III synthase
VVVEPMLRIDFLPLAAGVPPPAAIIFTSGNAVRAVAKWPAGASWTGVPAFAVGRRTAALASDAGFVDIRTAAGDADALIELVSQALDRTAGTILYPAPPDRAGDVDGRLAASGFAVRTIEAYRAAPAERLSERSREAIRRGEIDGALFFSRRTAATFGDLVKRAGLAEALGSMVLFAISAEVADTLGQFPSAGIRVASRPDAESLLALLPKG